MFGPFALATACLFAGAAIYVSWTEHPARMSLDDRAMLAQWKPSYDRGLLMQGGLALIGTILGVLEWIVTGSYVWLVGALVLLANWPFTIFRIMPVNDALKAIAIDAAGERSRQLLSEWGRLHAVRSVLGIVSAGIFLWALI